MGDAEAERIARWSIAKTYRLMGRVQEALDIQLAQLKEMEGKDAPYVQEEVGECLFAQGKEAEAKPYLARAHELLSRDIWLQANEPERLKRLAELGSVGVLEC